MIEGRFVKDGKITEIFLPDGLTELKCEKEIEAFTFKPRVMPVKKKEGFLRKALVVLSLGTPAIPVALAFTGGISFTAFFILSFIFSSWVIMVVSANL